jgi:UDP-N-acetylglucosamine--N-acetylmuramyl-(pentapeptide) pyrophosphoryl-undecaprenol N-acetylglucosamine transferase
VHDAPFVVFFAGGGTGGHLYPALALADALGSQCPGLRPVFVGADRGVEARILPARGVEHVLLPVRGVQRGVGVVDNLGVGPALLRSLSILAGEFQRHRPELVVVTGGYAGAPAGLMAAASRVPLALQEQNAAPGITTRLLAPFAAQIHLAFPEAAARLPRRARRVVEHSGNPVRPPEPRDRAADRAGFGLDPARPVLLVTGASQGSRALNAAVLELVARRREAPPAYQILWSTGPAHHAGVDEALAALGSPSWVRALGYIDDMPAALAAADVAVGRAGAMTTSEFLAWGLPSVIVPLPTAAADHQTLNARALAEAGTAIHLPEAELDGAALDDVLEGLFSDPARREALAAAALERARPHAAVEVARRLAELLPMRATGGAA